MTNLNVNFGRRDGMMCMCSELRLSVLAFHA